MEVQNGQILRRGSNLQVNLLTKQVITPFGPHPRHFVFWFWHQHNAFIVSLFLDFDINLNEKYIKDELDTRYNHHLSLAQFE